MDFDFGSETITPTASGTLTISGATTVTGVLNASGGVSAGTSNYTAGTATNSFTTTTGTNLAVNPGAAATVTSVGNTVTITGGAGGGTSGAGGAVTVTGGVPTAGAGGAVSITAAAGVGTNQAGGNVTITAGARTGSGTAGVINLVIPATGALQLNSAAGSAGQVLTSNGATTAPTWSTPSGSSPLTTKGDLYTFSSVNTRLPVGTDGQALLADSTQTTGLRWGTVSAGAAGADTQIQFNDGGTALGGDADFTWDKTNNRLTLGGTDTELEMQGITNEPSTPSAGRLLIYVKDVGGRMMPKWIGPAGVDTQFQAHLGFNRIMQVAPASGTTASTAMQAMGTAFTSSGTIANPTPTTGSLRNSMRRTTFSSGSTAGTVAYNRATVLECFRGNAAGLGGFFYVVRFSLDTIVSGNRAYFGLVDTVSNPTNIDPTSSTTLAKIGMAINTNSGNWNIVHNTAGSAVTSTSLGANFPVDNSTVYELVLFAAPNGSSVTYRVTNLTTGNSTSGTFSSGLPASTSFLAPTHWITNNATSSAAIMALHRWYLETDN